MHPAEDIVQVTLTRRQAERLYDLLTIGGIRGFGVSGAKERIRTALEAGGIIYDWGTIKANLLRREANRARAAQSGCSERP